MADPRNLGVIGGLILFLGTFAPVVSLPVVGSINYFSNGKGDGILILAMAAAALVLSFTGRHRWLAVPGFGAVCVLLFTLFTLRAQLNQIESSVQDTPLPILKELGGALSKTIQIQWGWGLLFVGAGALVAASVIELQGTAWKGKSFPQIVRAHWRLVAVISAVMVTGIVVYSSHRAYQNVLSEREVLGLVEGSDKYQQIGSYETVDFTKTQNRVIFRASDIMQLDLSKAPPDRLSFWNQYHSMAEKYAIFRYMDQMREPERSWAISLITGGLVDAELKPVSISMNFYEYKVKTSISEKGKQKGCILVSSDDDAISLRISSIRYRITRLDSNDSPLKRLFGSARSYTCVLRLESNQLIANPGEDTDDAIEYPFRLVLSRDVKGEWTVRELEQNGIGNRIGGGNHELKH